MSPTAAAMPRADAPTPPSYPRPLNLSEHTHNAPVLWIRRPKLDLGPIPNVVRSAGDRVVLPTPFAELLGTLCP